MKKIFALILTFAMIFSAAACSKDAGEETTVASASETTITEPATEAAATAVTSSALADATITSQTTQATTAKPVPTTVKPVPTTVKPVSTTNKPTTTKAPAKVPSGKEEILAVFNSAVNGAVSAKAGYSKTRSTSIISFSPDSLFKLPLVGEEIRGAVYSFLGVGTETSSAAKGKVSSPAGLKKSSLTQADITSASCILKNGNYEITLKLKDGDSKNTSSALCALDRSPICTGSGDKAEYDHKTASNIYTGISNAGASTTAVSESYSGAVVKATVNSSTGKLKSLTVSFTFNAELKGVKYVIKVGDCSGKAKTVVEYTDFKY